MRPTKRGLALAIATAVFLGLHGGPGQAAQALEIYETGFEEAEGFTNGWTLVGLGGWTAFGTGGNGFVTGFFEGSEQQAYLGFNPPGVKLDDENLDSFAGKLKQQSGAVSAFVWSQLSTYTRDLLSSFGEAGSDRYQLRDALVEDLYWLIQGELIYDPQRFAGVTLSAETQQLLSQNPTGDALTRLNRFLLVDAYPQELAHEEFFSLLVPLNYVPDANHPPVVKFSVLLAIYGSTTTNRDDFRWSAYNLEGERLLTVDFDTSELQVNYALDDGEGFRPTSVSFAEETLYTLSLTMDFARNRWRAALDGEEITREQPITTKNAALNLADIDPVWAIYPPGSEGDNFMVFDNYLVTAEAATSNRPSLELTPLPGGEFLVRLKGEPGLTYTIEASADLQHWIPIKTGSTTDGTLDHRDTDAGGLGRRFYRAREGS